MYTGADAAAWKPSWQPAFGLSVCAAVVAVVAVAGVYLQAPLFVAIEPSITMRWFPDSTMATS